VVEQVEDLAFVLDVIDLLRLQYLNLFEYLRCEKLAGLLLFDQSHASESACIGGELPTPMVVSI
jgi:hypothetical protein